MDKTKLYWTLQDKTVLTTKLRVIITSNRHVIGRYSELERSSGSVDVYSGDKINFKSMAKGLSLIGNDKDKVAQCDGDNGLISISKSSN